MPFRLSSALAPFVCVALLVDPTFAQSVDADPSMSWADFPGQKGRPHAPWVFRCTLEDRPRMLVLALAPECWVAYDAQGCRFDKAWQGGVVFDGSVYTGAHGPNPTLKGDITLRGPSAAFATTADGATKDVVPRWNGYRFVDGHAVLMSSIGAGTEAIEISERPEIARDGDAAVLERRIEVKNLAKGSTLSVRVPLVRPDGSAAVVKVNGKALTAEAGAKDVLVPLAADSATVITTDVTIAKAGAR